MQDAAFELMRNARSIGQPFSVRSPRTGRPRALTACGQMIS